MFPLRFRLMQIAYIKSVISEYRKLSTQNKKRTELSASLCLLKLRNKKKIAVILMQDAQLCASVFLSIECRKKMNEWSEMKFPKLHYN